MKKSLFNFLFVFVFIILLHNISATITLGNPNQSIITQYTPNSTIKGWINASFSNENINSTIGTNFGDSINIIKLLNLGNPNYICSPADCGSSYSIILGSTAPTETFTLKQGQSKLIGLSFSGKTFNGIYSPSNTIPGFSMGISSDATASITPQLQIDILNDGQVDWWPHTFNSFGGSKINGCYNEPAQGQSIISSTPYCEKITIPPAPSVSLGAYIIAPTPQATGSFTFSISSLDGSYPFNSCSASVTGTQVAGCTISNFNNYNQKDFFVCISSTNNLNGDTIGYEQNTPLCGYTNSFSGSYYNNFNLSVIPGSFASVGSFTLNQAELTSANSPVKDIINYINNYIKNKYNNDCSNNCIVPINFTSNLQGQQTITISNVLVYYSSREIGSTTLQNIIDINQIPGQLNSGFQQIYFDNANFSVPGVFNNYTLSLALNNNPSFLSIPIIVQKVPLITTLTPSTIVAGYPNKLTLNLDNFGSGGINITNYQWNFGDNTTNSSNVNQIQHTYNSLGSFIISVNVTNSLGLSSSKSFNVTVSPPRGAVNYLLQQDLNNLANLVGQINNLPAYQQATITSSNLNINSSSQQLLTTLQQQNGTAISDQDYLQIMSVLQNLNIPNSINITNQAQSIPLFPQTESINPNVLKDIGGGNFQDPNSVVNATILWNINNLFGSTTNYQEYSALSGNSGSQKVMEVFVINLNTISSNTTPYFIMKNISNLNFKDITPQGKNGYVYFQLSPGQKTIEFATTDDYTFDNLPMFISPPISQLSLTNNNPIPKNSNFFSNNILLISSLILIIVLGVAAYFIMKWWYKRKYENYLFKNRNDLYNIISYINDEIKKKTSINEISASLKKSGWSSEQIRYVTRKYVGKNPGL